MDLKKMHADELTRLRAQMCLLQRREQELLAILATFEAIEAQKQQPAANSEA
jgi:hypothetical protein